MIRPRLATFWRQLRERIQLLNKYADGRPPRDEARTLIERQRRQRRRPGQVS